MVTDEVVLRRFAGRADIPAMTALINAHTRRNGHGEFVSEDDLAATYDHLVRCDPERDITIAERAGDVVGYARTGWDDTTEGQRHHWMVVEADPAVVGVEAMLFEWCRGRALDVAAEHAVPGARLVAAALVGSDREAMLTKHGFEAVRAGYFMVRPHLRDIPAAPLPEGVEIRPVEVDHLRAIFDADNVAFRDHWGHVERTEDDWLVFADGATSGTGTSLWQVAWAGDAVVGQVRARADDGDVELCGRRRAWTEEISTAPGWRKRGIATAVICASLRQLAELGYEEAALGVDAENLSGALGLYESLGYAVVATDVVMMRPVDP